MSALPEISPEKVYHRLSSNLANKQTDYEYKLANLELLAEALRDERDEANRKITDLQSELDQIKQSSEEEPIEGEVIESDFASS